MENSIHVDYSSIDIFENPDLPQTMIHNDKIIRNIDSNSTMARTNDDSSQKFGKEKKFI